MEIITIILALVFVALFVVVGPFVTVWAINTAFGTTLAMSPKVWAAFTWLHAICASTGSRSCRGKR